jgi:hypothetical protein
MNRRRSCRLFAGIIVLSMGILFASMSTGMAAAAPHASPAATIGCQEPILPAGTPAPTSVTGPSRPSSSSPSTTVSGPGGTTETLQPVCVWTMSFDPPTGDPTVTFTEYANVQMNVGSNYNVDYSNNTGVSCDMTVDVVNAFGGGAGQEEITGSFCNTDGYGPGESSVQGVLVNGTAASVDTVASFNNKITSFASGANISYGFFNACSEDPVGSHTSYACDYFYGGPNL